MKEKLPKNWNYGAIGIIILCFFTAIIFIFNNTELIDIYKHTTYSTDERDRLYVGTPKYIDYENITTRDKMHKNNNTKYSQIEIQNISNETIYDVRIVLKEQQNKITLKQIIPSYNIVSLEPNEVALLSTQHDEVDENSQLKVEYYYYKDGKGVNYRIENSTIENSYKKGIYIEKDDEYYKYKNITKKANRISITNINTVKEKDKLKYTLNIKNNSDIKLSRIYLILKQYDGEITIGSMNYSIETDLNPRQEVQINILSSKDIILKLEGYSYIVMDNVNSDKDYTDYLINTRQGNYYVFKYEDYELKANKNKIVIISNVIMIFILFILNKIYEKLEYIGNLQIDNIKIKYSKYIIYIRRLLLIMYLLFLIYFYK